MHTVFPEVGTHADGVFSLSYKDAADWILLDGAQSMALLLGDENAGPFFFITSSEPRTEELHRVPAHGHDSDSWRITVQGTTNMGRETFTSGQFRFHDGGKPYAADNATWGPDGGFGLVMFADRRGFPVRPVSAEDAAKSDPDQELIAEILGVEVVSPLPSAPAIATTFGATERAHLNESFASADAWDEIHSGVRVAAGVLGDPECGPVVLMLEAEAGTTVLPALRADCEILHIVVRGTGSTDRPIEVGDLWFHDPGTDAPGIIAGDDGLSLVAVITNRRSIATLTSDDQTFLDAVTATTEGLTAQLAQRS